MHVISVMAHQDDERSCLGTMLKMKKLGHEIGFVCVTDGSTGMVHMPDMPLPEAAAIRRAEMEALAARAGARYICLNEPDEFLYDTPAVRVALIAAIRELRADVIFTHSEKDYNLDHMTVSSLVRQCAMQAPFPMLKTDAPPLKTTPAVFLVEPSGGFEFEATHWVDITAEMEEKMALTLCHKSQNDAFHAAFGPDVGIDSGAREASRARGVQAAVAYAEAFRPMLSRGLVKPYPVLP